MKKFFLIIFILLDLAVLWLAGMFLYTHLKQGQMTPVPNVPLVKSTSPVKLSTATQPAISTITAATTSTASSASIPLNARKIGFTYHNSKARQVSIRADFTGWRSEPMQKNPATNIWKYIAVLEPGEYAYCFTVDDKTISDPANKHKKRVGQTMVSSIMVQASPSKTH